MTAGASGRVIEEYFPKTVFTRRFPGFEEAVDGLVANRGKLWAVVDSFAPAELDRPLSPGKWSPGEVVDHLILTNELFTRVLCSVQDGAELLIMPMGRLSDEGKAITVLEGEPRSGRTREELLVGLSESTGALVEQGTCLQELGRLDEACMVHAFFGEMTAVECLQLQAWHFGWHLRQLPKLD